MWSANMYSALTKCQTKYDTVEWYKISETVLLDLLMYVDGTQPHRCTARGWVMGSNYEANLPYPTDIFLGLD